MTRALLGRLVAAVSGTLLSISSLPNYPSQTLAPSASDNALSDFPSSESLNDSSGGICVASASGHQGLVNGTSALSGTTTILRGDPEKVINPCPCCNTGMILDISLARTFHDCCAVHTCCDGCKQYRDALPTADDLTAQQNARADAKKSGSGSMFSGICVASTPRPGVCDVRMDFGAMHSPALSTPTQVAVLKPEGAEEHALEATRVETALSSIETPPCPCCNLNTNADDKSMSWKSDTYLGPAETKCCSINGVTSCCDNCKDYPRALRVGSSDTLRNVSTTGSAEKDGYDGLFDAIGLAPVGPYKESESNVVGTPEDSMVQAPHLAQVEEGTLQAAPTESMESKVDGKSHDTGGSDAKRDMVIQAKRNAARLSASRVFSRRHADSDPPGLQTTNPCPCCNPGYESLYGKEAASNCCSDCKKSHGSRAVAINIDESEPGSSQDLNDGGASGLNLSEIEECGKSVDDLKREVEVKMNLFQDTIR